MRMCLRSKRSMQRRGRLEKANSMRPLVSGIQLPLLLTLSIAAARCLALDTRAIHESPPLEIQNGESVLLLDDYTVAQTTKLAQEFFPAQRHPSNPVMKRTQAWEGVGPYIWGNRLMQDEKTGEFRLWYIAYDFNGNFYRWG